jgi:DNA-nicking Smr family endonuclease
VKEKTRSHPKPRQRQLSVEEIELWLAVTQSVTARKDAYLPSLSILQKPIEPDVKIPAPAPELSPKPRQPKLQSPFRPSPPVLAPLEKRMRQKLSRGQLAPEASIDLHGMGQHQAYVALQQFLKNAQSSGIKLVLVVTGKGERGHDYAGEPGILRRSVPLWLSESFYRTVVVGFEEAARPHGGSGALYVRIRRFDRGMKVFGK